ncbi:Myb-related transcription factor [Chlorella sorokiniana]|uniref:Myb-related transcription factor n=1 Tax=Chlorella sorokiniana TaxID=3076 RepID=A0A2P6TJ11_CHLSO|nr:Myb-related transcription factor [Chlorella sorokiniana]|eukprot:PRW39202.1 Myb-related transcription factor [Chlorella sorokiniana]
MAHSTQEPEELDRADEERGDRMRWNRDNQAKFEAAVEAAGGVLHAMPRAILDSLRLPGVSYAQVKSHLQRYRTAYVADCLARGEMAEQQRQHQRAWHAMQQALQTLQRECVEAIVEARHGPAGGMQPPSQQQQQPPLQQPQAGGLQGGAGGPSEAQLLQTLIALSSQQLSSVQQQQQQPALPPLQLGSQGGLWEQRLRAQLAGSQGGGSSGINSLGPGTSPFQPVQPTNFGPQPPAAQPQQQAQQQAAPQPQQQAGQAQQGQQAQQAQQGALPVDDAVSMLLNCFPAPAGGSGAAAIGSDLEALLKSSGSESGDSLLGSLLRAAGGQPGVDDLAAMLSSL